MMLDSADEDPSDQDLFVVEQNAFKRLCSGLVQHYLSMLSLVLACYHASTCTFAGLGEVKQRYIHSVYVDKLYQQIISDAVEESMKAAVDRVNANPDFITSGEWVITDARHDSTSNAYHTTVPCLAGSTLSGLPLYLDKTTG
ncbi:hypothetical protein EMCRGX_G033042 [Ephydatia muelleri]